MSRFPFRGEGCGGRPYGRQYKCCLAAAGKTVQPPCGRGNAIPLWWLAPPPFPLFEVALWVLSHGAMSLQESIERFILPPEQGWQGNTIRKGAKRPENRVTRFPVEKSGAAG